MSSALGNHTPRKRNRRSPNVCDCGEHGFVAGTMGAVAFFDANDIDIVRPWNWSSAGGKYVSRREPKSMGGKNVALHHAIAGDIAGFQVDHIDGNGLNNRRANLRHVTRAQNQMNRHAVVARSGFKGVSPNHHNWMAIISKRTADGKRQHYYMGTHTNPVHAALAYDMAARELFGPYARTNFQQITPEFF